MQPNASRLILSPVSPSRVYSISFSPYLDALVPVSAMIVLSCVRAAIPDGQPA
jgi:hypothetical protein